ncbi:MAG TPA: tautomerase family protein [Methylomirabilota bacterium]|nr:tautomerase family protein [Methylomirabilota bacterium]
MPLVRIDVMRGRSEAELAAIGAAIHRALGECLDVPERDHFQVLTAHAPDRLVAGGARVRPQDVVIVLAENAREDWSFGDDVAQSVTMPREHWK